MERGQRLAEHRGSDSQYPVWGQEAVRQKNFEVGDVADALAGFETVFWSSTDNDCCGAYST
jgi:hypothetical protein